MNTKKRKLSESITKTIAGAGVVAMLCISGSSFASTKIELDENRWISIGAGIRTGFSITEDASPSGDASTNFDVQSMRLYFNAQVHENVKFTFNTEEIFGDGPVDVLDAFVQFEFTPQLNIWVGRMLTPADRIEMNGPYYGLTWNQYTQPLYPSDQGGSAGTYGRDDGVTVWGASNKFQYSVGMFDGLEGFSNSDDNMLLAGRFAYNFLNMEDNPGYYTSSTYYGGLGNIFTLGLSFQSQDGGSGSSIESGDFSGYSLDLLSETVLNGGAVLTVEAEYKSLDSDFTGATLPSAGSCFCLFDGDSSFVSAAYLFSEESGPGKFQPYLRIVKNTPSDSNSSDLTELGLNYVISGHNARLNANFSSGDANISGYAGADVNSFSFGAQLQF